MLEFFHHPHPPHPLYRLSSHDHTPSVVNIIPRTRVRTRDRASPAYTEEHLDGMRIIICCLAMSNVFMCYTSILIICCLSLTYSVFESITFAYGVTLITTRLVFPGFLVINISIIIYQCILVHFCLTYRLMIPIARNQDYYHNDHS